MSLSLKIENGVERKPFATPTTYHDAVKSTTTSFCSDAAFKMIASTSSNVSAWCTSPPRNETWRDGAKPGARFGDGAADAKDEMGQPNTWFLRGALFAVGQLRLGVGVASAISGTPHSMAQIVSADPIKFRLLKRILKLEGG